MSIATGPLQSLLERDSLAAWSEASSVPDLGAFWDTLRDGLTAAQESYRAARWRHDWHGADEAMSEVRDLTGLLDVLADEMQWRRGQYLASGRLWPLA